MRYQSMRSIDDYWTGDGDTSDSNSIDNNNTSAFCYRQITGGGNLSNHAWTDGPLTLIHSRILMYGAPRGSFSGALKMRLPNVDRACGDPHVIVENDVCYNIFAK